MFLSNTPMATPPTQQEAKSDPSLGHEHVQKDQKQCRERALYQHAQSVVHAALHLVQHDGARIMLGHPVVYTVRGDDDRDWFALR